jgi:hypothetical protein
MGEVTSSGMTFEVLKAVNKSVLVFCQHQHHILEVG